MMFILVLLIGLVFSPIAGVMAFLITYKEYEHHYPSKKEPLRLALEAGIVTFALFMIIAILAGILISWGIR